MVSALILQPCAIIIEATGLTESKSRLNLNIYAQTDMGKRKLYGDRW